MNEEIRNKGWSQMKELLDREMPVKRTGLIAFYRIQAAAGVVLLLIAGMVYMGMPYFQNYESATPLTEGESTFTVIEKTTTDPAFDSPIGEEKGNFSENKIPDIRDGSDSGLTHHQPRDEYRSAPSPISSPNNRHSSSDLAVEMGYPKTPTPTKVELVNIELEDMASERPVDEHNSQYTPNPAVLSTPFLSHLPIAEPVLSMIYTALPEEENEEESMDMLDDETLRCPSGLALGLSWKKPSGHNLHGLGLHIGGKKTWEKSALIASIGLTKYGWFGSSGADVQSLSDVWNSQDPESEAGFVFQREYAQELISNYWEVDLEVAWRYYAFPKFSVGPQIRLARVFDTKIKPNRDYNFDSGGLAARASYNTDGQFLVNSYYLSAGLGLTYDFNCKWGVELTYQHHLSHFWKEEESRSNGRAYTLGLGAKMGLNRSN